MDQELKKLVLMDFNFLYEYTTLDFDNKTKEAILPQSLVGRLLEGHGPYFGEYFKDKEKLENVEYEEILKILGLDKQKNLDYRTRLIKEVCDWAMDTIQNPPEVIRFLNNSGKPLARIESLRNIEYPIEKMGTVFKGLIASFMDSDYWRERTIQTHPKTLDGEIFTMGYGQEEPINLNKLEASDQTSIRLQTEEHTKEQIKELRKQGIIEKLENSKEFSIKKGIKNMYIRGKMGLGGCDDAMLNSIGLIHGAEAYPLGILIDFLDTMGKHCNLVIKGGVDEVLGQNATQLWKKKYNQQIILPKDITDVIYLGAKNNFPKINFSSSCRRFMEFAENSSQPTFMEHYNWILNGTVPTKHKLGFEGVNNETFYKKLTQRFDSYELKECVKKQKQKPTQIQLQIPTNILSKKTIPKKIRPIFYSLGELLSQQGIPENEIQKIYINVPLFNFGTYSSRLELEDLGNKQGLIDNRNVQLCNVPSKRRINKKLEGRDYKELQKKFHSSLDMVLISAKEAIIIKKDEGDYLNSKIRKKFQQSYGKNARFIFH